jgi:hypothetical protein
MILAQIATALAVGIYVVLSKDVQHNCRDATPRESLRLQHSADHLLDRAGCAAPSARFISTFASAMLSVRGSLPRTGRAGPVTLGGAKNPTPSISISIGTKHLDTTSVP